MAGIESYGVALPTLRLPASAYVEAWGACAARGLKQKAFCAYDEDPVTLGIEAAREALARLPDAAPVSAVFFGVTTPPFEEKPSASTLATALFENAAIRVTEITGSPQAGVQALVSAIEYCLAGKQCYALAVAADAPNAPPDAGFEHALGAAAAAFVVGPNGAVAKFESSFSVTRETFGSRFRRHGDETLSDLELRTRDNLASAQALGNVLAKANLRKIKHLAVGADAGLMRHIGKTLGCPDAKTDALWSRIGDAGAAATAFVVGPNGAVAKFESSFSVTRETFGSRFRRHGDETLSDLELRTRDNLASAQALGNVLAKANLRKIKHLAVGADAGLMRHIGKTLGCPDAKTDALWSRIGDAGAAATAFVVGPNGAVAKFESSFSVTRETFGSRFRRHGDETLSDLELRTRDNLASAQALGNVLAKANLRKIKHLAVGADAGLMRHIGKTLGCPDAKTDALWSRIGDAGAAATPFALAAALDIAHSGDSILCAGIGSGATAASFSAGKELAKRRRKGIKVADLVAGGKPVDYVTYLKHRRMLSSRFGGAG